MRRVWRPPAEREGHKSTRQSLQQAEARAAAVLAKPKAKAGAGAESGASWSKVKARLENSTTNVRGAHTHWGEYTYVHALQRCAALLLLLTGATTVSTPSRACVWR